MECSFLHYVIIVKIKKFESVERECDEKQAVDGHNKTKLSQTSTSDESTCSKK